MRLSRTLTALVTGITALTVPAAPAHADPVPPGTVSERGVIRTSVNQLTGDGISTVSPPVTPPVPQPSTAPQLDATPADEAFKDQCESQDAALDETGWFRDRYSQCIRRNWIIVVHLNGVPTGYVTAEVTMLGYGSNGTREVRYVTFVDDIKKTRADNLILETVQIQASIVGCSAPLVDCPVVTSRDALVPAWRLQEDWSISFTSPDVAGGGEQRVPQTLYQRMWAYSAQPNYVWTPPVDFGTSRSRYDSASYVGAAKGAVFPEYKMTFTVDVNDPSQDESAQHILDAQENPSRTFPSWVGKSVPGKTEPLTRLYTSDGKLKDSNRTKSIATCRTIWGDYDGEVQQCDEYPFASTYQGAATGAPEPSDLQRYSVRVIDGDDNVHVGRDMLENNFYKTNRVLDGDQFLVHVDH